MSYQSKLLFTVCQGGNRAAIGHSVLEKVGFYNIKSHSAGMNEWVRKDTI